MNKAAIYHRPESEYAYLYNKEKLVHIRLKTAKNDVKKVELVYADPYDFTSSGGATNGAGNGDTHWHYKKKALKKLTSTDVSDYYQTEVTVATKRMDYLFVVTGKDGEKIVYTDKGELPYKKKLLTEKYAAFRLPYFHEIDRFKAPEWVKSRVWYQIFPERFANGDKSLDPQNVKAWNAADKPDAQDFYGGDLQGVLDHLDHLTELGVNGIYFTPVFKAPSNHKYDTQDYLEIDPNFGDKPLFQKVIEEAHKRGMKVMLDAVFNHIGDTSPQWQDVLANQENSKFADWFHVNEWPASYKETGFESADDLTYDTFAFTPHMPKLNTANKEVQDYLLNIADYWIREFDIDAWRLDVADEVDHHFWKQFRATCDAAKKDFYILGEVWHSAQPWLVGDEFSAVMNYAYTGAITDYFAAKKINLPQMVSAMNAQLMLYRKQTNEILFNVLDSHDTPRLLHQAHEDKDLMRQIEAFTYLQPGVPCIWQGDEYAMTGAGDPDCRRVMPWNNPELQDMEMLDFFKNLIDFRKKHAEMLATADMSWEAADEKSGLIILRRGRLTGVFNTGKKALLADINGKVLLSALTKGSKIKPKGFVIVEH